MSKSKAKSAAAADKTPTVIGSLAPAEQNPVKATERDTPVLIQYSPDEPAPAVATSPSPAPAATDETIKSAAVELLQAATVTTPEAKSTGETVKIKMLRSHPRLGYDSGQEGEIPQALYDELQADGLFFEKL